MSENCLSSMGKAEVAKMTFSSDFSFIKTELGCVEEMMRIISANQPLPLDNIHDMCHIWLKSGLTDHIWYPTVCTDL